ncbi:MAG: hypothetical protein RBU30_08505 [Polyangia bacterium]|jgi:hypothetical protein|nr:hypothetical protein [Polyangia bacterium]
MKVKCLREAICLDDVSVFGLSDAQVPAWEMLEEGLADVTFGDEESYPTEARSRLEIEGAPNRFRVRTGASPSEGEVMEVEGMIIGEGPASIISFLEERYLPDEGSELPLDRMLMGLRRGEMPRADWRRMMERILGDEPSRRSHRPSFHDTPRPVGFLGTRGGYLASLEERQDAGGSFFLRSFRRSANLAIVADYAELIEGHHVPRRRFAFAGEEGGVAGWDGRRYHVAEDFAALPESLRRTLDRDGRMMVQQPGEIVPLSDLRPGWIIRVPYPSEVKGISEAGPLPEHLSELPPAFLLSARCPIALGRGSGVPLYEDLEESLAFLARRTGGGAYLPQMPTTPIEELKLSVEGRPSEYLVACWPS